jgi:hypothetical protein
MFAGFFNANPGFECMQDGCENERSENQQLCPDCKNGLITFNMEREPIGLTPPNSPGNAIHQAYHGGAAAVLVADLLQRVPEDASMRLPPHARHPDYRNMNQDNPGAVYRNPNQGAPAYHGP